MSSRTLTEEAFLKDVDHHVMTIIRDEGVHRHIRCALPNNAIMRFDIVTYPHYLVFSGDMGCFVFSRIDDMFEFFRSGLRDPGKLQINEGYWAEKLEATERHDGHKKYSSDRFREYVKRWLDEYDLADQLTAHEVLLGDESDAERTSLVLASKHLLQQRLDSEVLSHADDHEAFARHALASFEVNGHRPFQDSWEVNFDEYTLRFLWCCYAIVWTIKKYDAAKSPQR